VVIVDFDFMGVPVLPDEANAPLVIDADIMPAFVLPNFLRLLAEEVLNHFPML